MSVGDCGLLSAIKQLHELCHWRISISATRAKPPHNCRHCLYTRWQWVSGPSVIPGSVFLISGKAEARERAILLSRSRGNSSLSRLTCGHRVASGRSLMHTARIASRDYNKASPRRPVKRYAPPVSATFDGRTATLIGALDFQHGASY